MQARWKLVGLAGLLAACAPKPLVLQYAGPADEPPDWRNEPVVCLLDSEEIAFVPGRDENHVRTVETAVYFVQDRNPPVEQDLSFSFEPAIEDTPQVEIELRYPDGRVLRPNPAGFQWENLGSDREYASGDYAWDYSVPGYGAGLRIAVRVQRIQRWASLKAPVCVRTDLPTLVRRLRLVSPSRESVKFGLVDAESLAVDTQILSLQPLVYAVRAENVPKIDGGFEMRHPENWYASLQCVFPAQGRKVPDWKDLGDAYLMRIAANRDPDSAVRAAAESLPSGDADRVIQEAFAKVVGKVRYLADEEGMHGWIPRPPGYVWKNGVGDCKEMSNLLSALLRLKGLESGLALVHAEAGFQPLDGFPTLGEFNHAIVYVKMPDGTLRLVDPTITFADAAMSAIYLAGQKALILAPQASRLVEIPFTPGTETSITTNTVVTGPDPGGMCAFDGQIVLAGPVAFDWMLHAAWWPPDPGRAYMRAALNTMLGLDVQSFRVDSAAHAKVYLTYHMEVQGKALRLGGGGLLVDLPAVYSGLSRWTGHGGPLDLAALDQEDTWMLPPGLEKMSDHPFAYQGASGAWSRNGRMVHRRFHMPRFSLTAADSGFAAQFRSDLDHYASAALWRP